MKEKCKEWKDKFDKWILNLDAREVTSHLFFLLAIINIWNIANFVIFLVLGIMWRYFYLDEKKKACCEVEEKPKSDS